MSDRKQAAVAPEPLGYGSTDPGTGRVPLLGEMKTSDGDDSPGRLLHRTPSHVKPWEFPGFGDNTNHLIADEFLEELNDHISREHPKLGQFPATAIAGNDITSSCLYVAGLVVQTAGKLAPIALVLVAVILHLFRKIYGEVVTALPLNGGAYNALLNTTSKSVASVAACLAILSYIATGVVSATEACEYLNDTWHEFPVKWGTIALLFLFAMLCFMGLTESAVVATAIFMMHIATLLLLCGACIVYTIRHSGGHLSYNWHNTTLPDVKLAGDMYSGNVFTAVFFGLCTSMLGISGFETSSQFVEEQAPGVFLKTLRNMWAIVTFFNPLIALLSLCVLRMDVINANTKTVLAKMGEESAGKWLGTWVSVDAFIVLSGAVLTSYVGVTGLMRRMAMDRCLPQTLLVENKWRGTNHFIIFGFFIVSALLFLILDGDVRYLSGVYTVSFLGVMALFALGCMLLKYKRPTLPSEVKSSWTGALIGMVVVIAAAFGNLLIAGTLVVYNFMLYLGAVAFIVLLMFQRVKLFKFMRRFSRTPALRRCFGERMAEYFERQIKIVNKTPIVFFAKRNKLAVLNKAVLYVRNNEQTHNMLFVHCYEGDDAPLEEFAASVKLLDQIYPKIRMDFRSVNAAFGPATVEWCSREFGVPVNMMFVTCPDESFPHQLAKLGGVRVITHA